jgi:hypothetical protein
LTHAAPVPIDRTRLGAKSQFNANRSGRKLLNVASIDADLAGILGMSA